MGGDFYSLMMVCVCVCVCELGFASFLGHFNTQEGWCQTPEFCMSGWHLQGLWISRSNERLTADALLLKQESRVSDHRFSICSYLCARRGGKLPGSGCPSPQRPDERQDDQHVYPEPESCWSLLHPVLRSFPGYHLRNGRVGVWRISV